jgi:hypothetical protein
VLADPLKAAAKLYPHVVRDRADVLVVEVKRVHQLAIEVELEM